MVKRSYVSLREDTQPLPDGDGTEPRTLIEDAYERIREDIIEGRLAPGVKLRVEHLKERYGVGAGTLREAITRLVSDALVVSQGQRGFWVAPISIDDLEDLTDLRMQIEIEALRRSIRAAQPSWRERVRLAYAELAGIEQPILPDQRSRWELLNARFHEALISGCDSPWTERILRLLSRQSERYRQLAIHLLRHGRDVHGEHQLIYEATMAGEEARAALALEMHIRATADLIVRASRDGRLTALTSAVPIVARRTAVLGGGAPSSRTALADPGS